MLTSCQESRGVNIAGVVLNNFPPSTKLSIQAKNVGWHYCFISLGCTHHFNSFCCILLALKQHFMATKYLLLDSPMKICFYCASGNKNVPQNRFAHADVTLHKTSSDTIVISSSSGKWIAQVVFFEKKKSVLKLCRLTVYVGRCWYQSVPITVRENVS